MRCARAQGWMTAAIDGVLSPRQRRAFDRHVAACPGCQAERDRTARLLAAVAALPAEADVPARVEQATLRAVRLMVDDAVPAGWWESWGRLGFSLPVVAVAAAAAVVALRVVQQPPVVYETRLPVATKVARVPRGEAPRAVAARRPAKPLPLLEEAPDVFAELGILRNLEKLRHFDQIQTTTVDDRHDPGAGAPRGDG